MHGLGMLLRENQPRVYLLQAPILLRTGYICRVECSQVSGCSRSVDLAPVLCISSLQYMRVLEHRTRLEHVIIERLAIFIRQEQRLPQTVGRTDLPYSLPSNV